MAQGEMAQTTGRETAPGEGGVMQGRPWHKGKEAWKGEWDLRDTEGSYGAKRT